MTSTDVFVGRYRVVLDWPPGTAENAAFLGWPELGVWWSAVVGLVGGLAFTVLAGVLTAAGLGLLAGLAFGMLCGAATGIGLRGSPDELAFGLASLAGLLVGPLLLRCPLRGLLAEVSAYHRRR